MITASNNLSDDDYVRAERGEIDSQQAGQADTDCCVYDEMLRTSEISRHAIEIRRC